MQELSAHSIHPKLKSIVAEASRALAQLDADRLEELALSCQALNRDLETADRARRSQMAAEARDARADLATFGRVLDATRANLMVMKRICELRARSGSGNAEPPWRRGGHGDD